MEVFSTNFLQELKNQVAEEVVAQISGLMQSAQTPNPATGENYLTRKQTAEKLKVSLPTLNEYTKNGKINGYRFGVRVLYKQSEIEAALKNVIIGGPSDV